VLHGNLFSKRHHEAVGDQTTNSVSAIFPIPKNPSVFEGPVVVFDGPEDYHQSYRRSPRPASLIAHADHARRRPHRLSRRGGSGEHAPAGGAARSGHPFLCPASAMAASPATSGSPSILKRLAGSGGGRRAGAAQDRRPACASTLTGHLQCPGQRRGIGEAATGTGGGGRLQISRKPDALGRRCSAAVVGQMETGMVLEPAVKYQRNRPDQGHFRATITE